MESFEITGMIAQAIAGSVISRAKRIILRQIGPHQ
jgi:hypothetical protein